MRTFAFDFVLGDWRHLRVTRGPFCRCVTFMLGPLWLTWFRDRKQGCE